MENKKKLAYLPMAVDMIHPGHLNIIKAAENLGATVMVGCYADEAIASYKRLPFMSFDQRKEVVESIKGVDIVVKQESRDLEENIRKYKPDYVVHGTDWRDGALSKAREKTIAILSEWGGELVEPEYTEGISSTVAHEHLKEVGTTPALRQARLRKLLHVKKYLRGLEVHNGLSALVGENAVLKKSGAPTEEYDVLWLDSLTSSLIKGKLDVEIVDFTSRCTIINDIFDVTTKPLIFDGGSGGTIEQFTYEIKSLERMGVSAIAISGGNDIDDFCKKIKIGKKTQIDRHFMLIAKIEKIDVSVDEAASKVQKYIQAGIDAIMICSNSDDITIELCNKLTTFENTVPIMTMANADSKMQESVLNNAGINLVLYSDNLLRALYPAMVKEAQSLLENKCAGLSFTQNASLEDIKKILPN